MDAAHLDASRAVTGAAAVRTPVAGPLIDRRAHKHRGNAELRDAFPALVAEWEAYWGQQPWHHTVAADTLDPLLEVLRAILDAAMGEPDNPRPHERLLQAAVAHGEQRCRQGVSDEALLGEYHALRKALWRHLLHSASATDSLTTIFRVDVVISAASGLALRGFTRGLVPADFPWERELARAMTEVSENLSRALV